MAGVDNQSASFKAPYLPPQRPQGLGAGASINPVINRQAAAQEDATKIAELNEKKNVESEVFERHQDNRDLSQNLVKRAVIDSFEKVKAQNIDHREQGTQLSQFAGKIQTEKDLKQKQEAAKAFVRELNGPGLKAPDAADSQLTQDEVSNNQQLAGNVSQLKVDEEDKEKKKLEDKLEKIHLLGGDKGKGFVAFIRRELGKGPLSGSLNELIDGYAQTLKASSPSSSELIAKGEEPLSILRNMLAASNEEEQQAIQDSLARSIISSAGERADLMALRNLDSSIEKKLPPQPSFQAKTNRFVEAINFVSSINKGGSIEAPWEGALVA